MLRTLLFKLAKHPRTGRLIGLAFQYCPWAIPVQKAYCTRDVIAFRHPRPSYANHLILSPRRPIADLRQMASGKLCGYLPHLLDAARAIVTADPAYHAGFVLLANGGPKQEVQQVHFHLFTGCMIVEDASENTALPVLFEDAALRIADHTAPGAAPHWVLQPSAATGSRSSFCRSILQSIGRLDDAFGIVQRGYSLLWQTGPTQAGQPLAACHILARSVRT